MGKPSDIGSIRTIVAMHYGRGTSVGISRYPDLKLIAVGSLEKIRVAGHIEAGESPEARQFFIGIARGAAGALLFGLPMLMTK